MYELNRERVEYTKKRLESELMKYCGKAKQLRRSGTRIYCHQLLDCYHGKFAPRQTDEDAAADAEMMEAMDQ
jgi:hypothetical protein